MPKRQGRVKGWIVVTAIASAGLAACLLAVWPKDYMASREIGCERAAPGRSQEVCRALSASMEWTWFGHAIVSPGWRPTSRGVAQTWCSAHITDADLPLLEGLRHASSDWRLESAAEDLIRIAKNRNGSGDEPETSIFN